MQRILIILAGCLLAGHANAETVEIGSASVEMPAGVWKQVAASEGQNLINEGFTAKLAVDERAFALMDGERVLAILIIRSSKYGHSNSTKWMDTCEGNKKRYAYTPPSASVLALVCARATGRLNTIVYLKGAVPRMFNALEVLGSSLPSISYSASAQVSNRRGSLTSVNLVAAPTFAGSAAQPLGAVPAGVNPRHAAWADSLVLEVQKSVDSMNGKLVIPSVEFSAVATPARPANAPK